MNPVEETAVTEPTDFLTTEVAEEAEAILQESGGHGENGADGRNSDYGQSDRS